MGLFDPLKGFGVTFSTMFKKVVTEQYPEDFRPTAPRYHGRHQLNRHADGLEKCSKSSRKHPSGSGRPGSDSVTIRRQRATSRCSLVTQPAVRSSSSSAR